MDDPALTTPQTLGDTITVFLLDDHEIVRRGIADLLDAAPDLTVVGEAGTVSQALARITALEPQVAVLDARLPDGSGVDVCRDIHSALPGTRCIILTSYDDDDAVLAAVMAGAAGYLLKEIKGSNLIDAIRQVASGRSLLDPSVTERVLTLLREGDQVDPRFQSLSPRERQILDLVTDGLTNREIGAQLHLAEKTVKNYVSAMLLKLGMGRRAQAAVFGAQMRQSRD